MFSLSTAAVVEEAWYRSQTPTSDGDKISRWHGGSLQHEHNWEM